MVKDFNGLNTWHPAVATDEIVDGKNNTVGAVRLLTLKGGGTIKEKLLAFDPAGRSFKYAIVEGVLPVSGYTSTLAVKSAGKNKSSVTWTGHFKRKNVGDNPGRQGKRQNRGGHDQRGLPGWFGQSEETGGGSVNAEHAMNALDILHPAVAAWFSRTFDAPTAAQEQAWPALQSRQHVLVAAPTGSGKTFAAFLAAIDQLVKEGLEGPLPDETRIVYVSPLKALSNDIQRNLEAPLKGIREELAALNLPDVAIRAVVRTGDTSQAERAGMRRKPPHIVVTTPESLYILLGSASGRDMLATCRTVIVDEIHAIAGNKRGAHLALSLERLQALTGRRIDPRRIVGDPEADRGGREVPHRRERGRCAAAAPSSTAATPAAAISTLELPPAPLEAVMSGEVWTQVYDRLARAHPRASHHAGVRQHAQADRARGASSLGAARRGECRRTSRQPVQGTAPRSPSSA